MKIYDLLIKNRRPHLINQSREFLFFQKHEIKLNLTVDYLAFLNPRDDFNLIQMSIIIESLLNYEKLMNYYNATEEKATEFDVKPLFVHENVPIYCPLFSVSNNLLIDNGLGANLNLNNDTIDLFETYNFALYESALTSLVKVSGDLKTRAYYHYDFHTVYIVNDQGRLDQRISLFDKHIKKPDYRNVIDRLQPVLKAYYDNDLLGFIGALVGEKLISQKLYNKYMAFLRRKRRLWVKPLSVSP